MEKKHIFLEDLVDVTDSEEVTHEIHRTISMAKENFDFAFIDSIYTDICRLFKGEYPGYFHSMNKYHDLDHTSSVYLAGARLIHASMKKGQVFSSDEINIGLSSALFHDVGFIQTLDDQEGTGAKYTACHEERSIEFMQQYFTERGYPDCYTEKSVPIIKCTILKLVPKQISFPSQEIELLGKIIGTADLLAQMADRAYLEKLILLFEEFEEAQIPGFDSALELLEKTIDFYEFVAKKRLIEDFDDVAKLMRIHFQDRWKLDQDLYERIIVSSISYLKDLIKGCNGNYSCYLKGLRRAGVVEKLFNGDAPPKD